MASDKLIDALTVYQEQFMRFVKAAQVLASYYGIPMPTVPNGLLNLNDPTSIYIEAAHFSFLADWTETLSRAALAMKPNPIVQQAATADGSNLPPITGTLKLNLSDTRTN